MFYVSNIFFQECQLRHLRHLPNILQMQRILVSKFGKKVTREEAAKITLQEFGNQLSNGERYMRFNSICTIKCFTKVLS